MNVSSYGAKEKYRPGFSLDIAQENGDDKNPGRQTKPLLFFL